MKETFIITSLSLCFSISQTMNVSAGVLIQRRKKRTKIANKKKSVLNSIIFILLHNFPGTRFGDILSHSTDFYTCKNGAMVNNIKNTTVENPGLC